MNEQTPSSVSELLQLNEEAKKERNKPTELTDELIQQVEKLHPTELAKLVRGSANRLHSFHRYVVEKEIEQGATAEDLMVWVLDMKSWAVISQEIENLSDFCE